MQSLIIDSASKIKLITKPILLPSNFLGSGFVRANFKIENITRIAEKTIAVIINHLLLNTQPKIKNKIAIISISLFLHAESNLQLFPLIFFLFPLSQLSSR